MSFVVHIWEQLFTFPFLSVMLSCWLKQDNCYWHFNECPGKWISTGYFLSQDSVRFSNLPSCQNALKYEWCLAFSKNLGELEKFSHQVFSYAFICVPLTHPLRRVGSHSSWRIWSKLQPLSSSETTCVRMLFSTASRHYRFVTLTFVRSKSSFFWCEMRVAQLSRFAEFSSTSGEEHLALPFLRRDCQMCV